MLLAYSCVPRTYDLKHSLASFLLAHLTPRLAGLIGLCTLLLILHTWAAIVRNLYVTLSGRAWIINSADGRILLMAAVGWAGYEVYSHPSLRSALTPWAVPAIYCLAVCKLLLAAITFNVLRRRTLVTGSQIARAILFWSTAAATLALLLLPFLPISRHSIPILAAAIVLFLPLVRPALAVLTLHYNRHR